MLDTNRRKFPRVHYPCEVTLWWANKLEEFTILAHTIDIGLGGLGVVLDEFIPVGTKVDMQLNFSDTSIFFRCRGTIIHDMLTNDKYYNTGIQFETLSEPKYVFLSGRISECANPIKSSNNTIGQNNKGDGRFKTKE